MILIIGRKFWRAGYAPDKGCYETDKRYYDRTGVICMYMIMIPDEHEHPYEQREARTRSGKWPSLR